MNFTSDEFSIILSALRTSEAKWERSIVSCRSNAVRDAFTMELEAVRALISRFSKEAV